MQIWSFEWLSLQILHILLIDFDSFYGFEKDLGGCFGDLAVLSKSLSSSRLTIFISTPDLSWCLLNPALHS